MAQTHLIRKGMRPLTPEFEKAYRDKAEWDAAHSKRNTKPLRQDVTPEQFAEALETIGIGGSDNKERAKNLADALGLKSDRQAQNILMDPAKWLNELNRDKLLRRAQSAYCDAIRIEREEDSEPYLSEACFDAIDLLGWDERDARLNEASTDEFAARALVEGFLCLTDHDRTVLLRVLTGMLDSYARYRDYAEEPSDEWAEERQRLDRARLVSTLIERSGVAVGYERSYSCYPGLEFHLSCAVCDPEQLEMQERDGNSVDLRRFGPAGSFQNEQEFMRRVLDEYAGII